MWKVPVALMVMKFAAIVRQLRPLGIGAALLVYLLAGSCQQDRTANKLAQDSKRVEEFDNSLTFNAVTLEEFDQQGRLWWQMKAKTAVYSKDKKNAKIDAPKGQLFQDGKAIMDVTAKNGEVQQDGKTIFLRGDVVAVNTRDGVVMKGDEVVWQPEKDLLIVRNNVSAVQEKKMQVTAKEGQFFTRDRRLELMGQVVAVSVEPEEAKFQSDRITWQIDKEALAMDKPLQIDRSKDKVPLDRAVAQKGSVDLKTKVATLQQSAQVVRASPPVEVSSDSLVWNYQNQTIVSDKPVSMIDRQKNSALTGNQGSLDMKTNVITMNGNVRAVGEQNRALTCENLVFNLTTQQFQAEGNVFFQQASPPVALSGPRASGNLQDQTVVDGGSTGGRVTTEFIPR
ncbi:MAG TPA: LPS export ABC transporter periplasmic protein LptC [Thermosynechococcaceae cyanobacterium]